MYLWHRLRPPLAILYEPLHLHVSILPVCVHVCVHVCVQLKSKLFFRSVYVKREVKQ